MNTILPNKLQKGDTIRVFAPARSLAMAWLNNDELKDVAKQRFSELGLKINYDAEKTLERAVNWFKILIHQ